MTLPPGTPQAIGVPTMASAQRAETLGCVISVRGSQASVGLPAQSAHAAEKARASVGKFLGVRAGEALVVGLIADVSLRTDVALRDSDRVAVAQLDLIGEIQNRDSDKAKFQRGVSTYPAIGDTVTAIGSDELRLIFRSDGSRTIDVGQLQHDSSIPALLDVDEVISKHFAVLGTTGVGKSSAVTLLLHQILAARPDLRVLLLDVHNEYSRCFGERAQVLNPGNIKLPFWLYNFEEIVDVLFGGRPSLDEEVDILAECIPLAKSIYAQQATATGRTGIKSGEAVATRFTVDLPVPYRISDLIALLDARMGKLENRSISHGLSQADHPYRNGMWRSAIRLHVRERQCGRRHHGGDPLHAIPHSDQRRAADHHAARRLPFRSGRCGGVGNMPDGVRPRAVERRRQSPAGGLRGGAPLHGGRPLDRLRADPALSGPHCQGGPQIQRIPRPGIAASGGARLHHPVAMLDAVRDAYDQRS